MKPYQKIGFERIKILEKMCKEYPEKAPRYTYLMKKLSEKMGLPIPREIKRNICKECGEYLTPKKKKVRLKNKIRYVTCKNCGKVKRFLIKPR